MQNTLETVETCAGTYGPDELLRALPDIVRGVAIAKRDYIREQLEGYRERRKNRSEPVVAFLGHGRAGKDEGALWLQSNFAVDYYASTSQVACPLVAHALGIDEQKAFESRHQNRMFWKVFCDELRRKDPTILAKMCLSRGDIIVGIRGAQELDACVSDGVIDVTLWIDNPRVDPDPTVEFTVDDCDLAVRNATHKLDYYQRLRKLAGMLDLTPRMGHSTDGESDGQEDENPSPARK